MTNFDVLKNEIAKTNNPEELADVMSEFRYEIFPCNMTDKCIKDYSCQACYREWIMKEL